MAGQGFAEGAGGLGPCWACERVGRELLGMSGRTTLGLPESQVTDFKAQVERQCDLIAAACQAGVCPNPTAWPMTLTEVREIAVELSHAAELGRVTAVRDVASVAKTPPRASRARAVSRARDWIFLEAYLSTTREVSDPRRYDWLSLGGFAVEGLEALRTEMVRDQRTVRTVLDSEALLRFVLKGVRAEECPEGRGA